MKRIFYASALALTVASGVSAATIEATEQNLVQIQAYVPEATMVDLEAMSDTDIRVILNAISSGEDADGKSDNVRALFMDASKMDAEMATTTEFANETNLLKIQEFVPEATLADLARMENDQIASILNAISEGDNGADKAATVRALFEGDDSMVTHANATSDFVNETNLAKIKEYAPDIALGDLARIGDEQIALILDLIAGDDSEGDKRQAVQAYFK